MNRECLSVEDVTETLIWVAAREKINPFSYLLREKEAAKQDLFEKIQALVLALELSQDEEEKERLTKELEELNRWPTHR